MLLPKGIANHDIRYLLESTLIAAAALPILFRFALAPLVLRLSRDPELLYAAFSKLDRRSLKFVRNMPTAPYIADLAEDQFLMDYRLSPDIGYDRTTERVILTIATVIVLFISDHLQQRRASAL